MTEPRGTLLLKSTFHGAAPVEPWPIVVKELTVVGSRCGPFAKAIALLRSGKVIHTADFPYFSAERCARGNRARSTARRYEVLLKNT